MRRFFVCILLGVLGLSGIATAQSDSGYPPEQLDTLVAPIALYPDPLLSTVTTAATQPDQIAAAAQALKSGSKQPNPSWDTSVQALCSYPEVVNMMAQNKEWTSAVGWASANQVTDLMDAVQRFRFKAQSAGNLKSNDKIQVIEEGTTIRIEPANPQIIYVPQQVQTDDSSSNFGAVMGFSVGVAATALLYNNAYHWGSGYYHPPVGWMPPPGYYHPYGAAYPRATPYYPNTAVNRPVNVNNINTGNININNGNRYNNQVNNVNRNTQMNNVNRNAVAPSQYQSVSQPRNGAWGSQAGAAQRPAAPTQRPAMADYSRAGDATRASNRGASSRGTSSYSSGRSGRSGGGRRR